MSEFEDIFGDEYPQEPPTLQERWPKDPWVHRTRYYTTAYPCFDFGVSYGVDCAETDNVCFHLGTLVETDEKIRAVAIYWENRRQLQEQLDHYSEARQKFLIWDELQFRRAIRHGKITKNPKAYWNAGSVEERYERPLPPCGNRDCRVSSSIAGEVTFGSGRLDPYGWWEFPCRICEEAYDARESAERALLKKENG